jgi:DNA topoisomerase-1
MTDFKCEDCASPLLKRWSKNGWFLGCETYPKCKFTRDLGKDGNSPAQPRLTDFVCDKCTRPMVIKSGRYGEFLSCSGYPECKNAKPVPLGVPCPKCGGDIVEIRSKKRGSRSFYGCTNYPKCDFKVWQRPVSEPCPLCQHPFLVQGGGQKSPKLLCPRGKECGYSRPIEEALEGAEGTADGAASANQAQPSAAAAP